MSSNDPDDESCGGRCGVCACLPELQVPSSEGHPHLFDRRCAGLRPLEEMMLDMLRHFCIEASGSVTVHGLALGVATCCLGDATGADYTARVFRLLQALRSDCARPVVLLEPGSGAVTADELLLMALVRAGRHGDDGIIVLRARRLSANNDPAHLARAATALARLQQAIERTGPARDQETTSVTRH